MRYCTVPWLLLAVACGPVGGTVPEALVGRQPAVIKAVPQSEARLATDGSLVLTFSQPLEPSTVHQANIMLCDQLEASITQSQFIAQWEDDEVVSVSTSLAMNSDATQITVRSDLQLIGPRVALLITPGLISADGLPFSQSPGQGSRPYVQFHTIGVTAEVDEVDSGSNTSTSTSPAVASVSETMQVTSDADPATSTASDVPAPQPPSALVINELLYDIPGSDTNGVLFIELRGSPGGNIAGYTIRFVNGDGAKVTDTVMLPEEAIIPDDGLFVIADGITGNLEATHVANADMVDNFDPQNGPDSVQLLAPDGSLVDVLGYGSPLPLVDADGLALYEGTPAVDASGGESLSRLPGGLDTDMNNQDYSINTMPSPGTLDVSMK